MIANITKCAFIGEISQKVAILNFWLIPTEWFSEEQDICPSLCLFFLYVVTLIEKNTIVIDVQINSFNSFNRAKYKETTWTMGWQMINNPWSGQIDNHINTL